MKKTELEFFKQLSESFGPSGFEKEPLRLLKDYVEPFADVIESDKLGSLLYTINGDSEQPRINNSRSTCLNSCKHR
jgi:putative aminopeptidase FrvX